MGLCKCEETLQQLCTEAKKAWKDTNDLVFKCYDGQLMVFIQHRKISPREVGQGLGMHLQAHRHGRCITQCMLGLTLQVLNKLHTIPIDLSYCTLIPMMLNPRQVVTQAVRKVKVLLARVKALAVRVKALVVRMNQKTATHNRVTPAVR